MKHYNPTISSNASRIFNLKGESTSEINDIIMPIIPIEPVINIVKVGTADATIYTTPTDKDFYLCAAYITNQGGVGAAGTEGYITAYIDGVNVRIASIQHPTTTASAENEFFAYPRDIKIDRGTAIAITGGVGLSVKGIIYGYTVETIKGV